MAYYTDQQKTKIKQSIQGAFAKPEDPTNAAIIKRVQEGKMNFELKAVGLNPVPSKKPKVDLSKAMASQSTGQQTIMPGKEPIENLGDVFSKGVFTKESRSDLAGDVKETFQGVGDAAQKRIGNAREVMQDPDFNILQKFMGFSGQMAGGIADVGGEIAIGVGKGLLSESSEQGLKELAQGAGEAVSETEIAQGASNWYDSLDKDEQLTVDSVGGVAALATELIGLKGTRIVTKAGGETAEQVVPAALETGQQALETGARAAGEAVDAFSAANRPARVAAQQEKVNTAVSRITQAGDDPRAIEQAKRALSEIDTSDIKEYSQLNTRLDDRISALSSQVDQELGKVPGTFKPEDFAKNTQVGEELVVENPINDALQGLEEAYTKSGEAANASRVRQLAAKFETEGLSLKEANDLAREYGIEFRDRAFTKMGDPKAGYNAENYENVRKGVKEVVRNKMPDDLTKELDQKMSDIFATRDLTRKVSDRVAKLEQRIKNRTLAQRIGGGAAALLDLTTGGMLRGFVAKLLPSNMGNKAMNSIEIQKELNANLKELDKLLAMKDDAKFADAFEEWAKTMQPGMSIRSTVTPEKAFEAPNSTDIDLPGVFSNKQTLEEYNKIPDGTSFERGGVTITKQGNNLVATGENVKETLQKSGIEVDDNGVIKQKDFGYNIGYFLDDIKKQDKSFNLSETTKTTDLLSQAKGKSLDEFVEGQGEPMYHGTTNAKDIEIKGFKPTESKRGIGLGGNKSVKSPVVFLTKDKQVAKVFAENRGETLGRNSSVLTTYPNIENTLDLTKSIKSKKIIDIFDEAGIDLYDYFGVIDNNLKFERVPSNLNAKPSEVWALLDRQDVIDGLSKQGYDSAMVKENKGLGVSTAVFDPNKVKTKSQLEDIWNKANK